MCAIFGIGLTSTHRFRNKLFFKKLLNNLMLESEFRGMDATGLAFTTESKIVVIKHNYRANRFQELPRVQKAIDSYGDISKIGGPDNLYSIIGHCRFKTKGIPENNKNNHPIIANEVVGVHNGVISNDDILFSNYSNLPYIERAGQVDSEIIFRLIDFFINKGLTTEQAIKETTARIAGSFACALVTSWAHENLYLFKNDNPIALSYFPKVKIFVFASANAIIKKATNELFLGEEREVEIPPQHQIVINLTDGITKLSLLGLNVLNTNTNR